MGQNEISAYVSGKERENEKGRKKKIAGDFNA